MNKLLKSVLLLAGAALALVTVAPSAQAQCRNGYNGYNGYSYSPSGYAMYGTGYYNRGYSVAPRVVYAAPRAVYSRGNYCAQPHYGGTTYYRSAYAPRGYVAPVARYSRSCAPVRYRHR